MNLIRRLTFSLAITLLSISPVSAQSYTQWYNNAQERIDTLRKGNFGVKIIDENGEPYLGDVSVHLKKHEFPFGIAFDFYEGQGSMGNKFSTSSPIHSEEDKEIYQSERWNDYLAYMIPVIKDQEYKLTLKFAEIYFDGENSRLFDVWINGEDFLTNFDTFFEAGAKNTAIDTSYQFNAENDVLNIELKATKDNVAIKGIVLEALDGSSLLRINCGGSELTTSNGNYYVSESGFFNPDVNTVASNEQWMKAAMFKYFNYGVSGNSFKWSGIQPRPTTPDYTNFENAVSWAQKVGWDLRAHTLLWGGNDAHSMPDWVRNLPTSQAITDTCKMRVQREVERYKGIVKEYDVINEPLTGHADWLRNTVGDSIIWNCFKWAREVDPDAELFINDYNVEYNWGQAEEYRDLILEIKKNGGPVTGVGLQAHFWDCCRPNVNELVKNINIIAEAGLPLRLTEYDWGTDLTEKQQVDDFMMVATIAFSHPSVNGMICWGLGDQGAWRENTGFFNANYRPKLAADTLLYLTKLKWATNFDSVFNSSEPMNFNAYYGDYDLEVDVDGEKRILTLPCLKENQDSIFTINVKDSKLKGPQLQKAVQNYANEIILTFDKAIDETSLKRSDFKLFTTREIGLEDIQIDPTNNHNLILLLGKDLQNGVYASVAYFPGKLTATDGSTAEAFGPQTVQTFIDDTGFEGLDETLLKIYPNPAKNRLNVENESVPFKLEIFNTMGMKVHQEFIETGFTALEISQYNRGMYLIRITDHEQQCTTNHKILFE